MRLARVRQGIRKKQRIGGSQENPHEGAAVRLRLARLQRSVCDRHPIGRSQENSHRVERVYADVQAMYPSVSHAREEEIKRQNAEMKKKMKE